MSSFDQKLQLINHMNSLFDEGLLNEQFHQAEILRESHRNNSHFVAQFIATFCDGTQKLLADVDDILMGAYNMKNAIRPLIQYCKENDKDR
ncbi:uncharacterized protein A4U43_C09F210 [Asparagus officinalis]|uniref:Uncharacterized protein n=1 Tax=Asparagus officinalis TaxID=4686 RepID=A0A5P1E4F6_ASPOF|nr:uncharacterized protein A4U43_C09F210 [Asparagus officinalis]